MRILLLAALLSLSTPAIASAATPVPAVDGGDALHQPLTELLDRHVDGRKVDYAGLLREQAALDSYLASLADVDVDALGRPERFALWINAYNAFTLRLILDNHGEIDSIKDIPRSERWNAERWRVGGGVHSLDAIEHEILRPMGDARIHFAINCASTSCPPLLAEAYLPSRLDEQLDDAARRFVADTTHGLRTATEKGTFWGENQVLYLSKIFDWFEEDFERDSGNVVDYVLRFAPKPAADFIRRNRDDLDVEYFDYDWSLNAK